MVTSPSPHSAQDLFQGSAVSPSSPQSSGSWFSSCIKINSLTTLFSYFPENWEQSTENKIQYLVQIPFWAKEEVSLKELILKIQNEAFYPSKIDYNRTTLIIGINGKDTLGDLSVYKKVEDQVEQLKTAKTSLKIATLVLSFSWITPPGTTDTFIPRCAYHNFLTSNELTREMIAKLKNRNPSSEIYLVKLDADTINLRPTNEKGILSIYDEFITSRKKEQKPFPWLLTGGYITSGTQNQGVLRKDLDVGVHLDHQFRFALGRFFPSVPYYTEANSLILYSAVEKIADKLFAPIGPSKGNANEMEKVKEKLLAKARSQAGYNLLNLRDYFVFLDNPVQTDYRPDEANKAKPFGGFEHAWQLYAYTPEELYKLKEVWQSHYDLYNSIHKLGMLICGELGLQYAQNYHSFFQKIFKAYDPLESLNTSEPPFYSISRSLDRLFNQLQLYRVRSGQVAQKHLDDLKMNLLKIVNKDKFKFKEEIVVTTFNVCGGGSSLTTKDVSELTDFISDNGLDPLEIEEKTEKASSFDELCSIFERQANDETQKVTLECYIKKINDLTDTVERAAKDASIGISGVLIRELNVGGYDYVSRSIEKWAQTRNKKNNTPIKLADPLFTGIPSSLVDPALPYGLTIVHVRTFCISPEPLEAFLTDFPFQDKATKIELLNQQTTDCSTALEIAFNLSHFPHVAILIEHGADISTIFAQKDDLGHFGSLLYSIDRYVLLLRSIAPFGGFTSIKTVYDKVTSLIDNVGKLIVEVAETLPVLSEKGEVTTDKVYEIKPKTDNSPAFLCSQEGTDSLIHLAIENPKCSIDTIQLLATKDNVKLKGASGFTPLDLFLMNFASPLAEGEFKSYKNWTSFIEQGMEILLERGAYYEYSMSATYKSVLSIVLRKKGIDVQSKWHPIVEAYEQNNRL